MGERFTVADAYCFTVLSWARFHRIDLSAYTMVSDYLKRVSERPMVKRALQAEGLRSPPDAAKKGRAKVSVKDARRQAPCHRG